MVNLLPKTEKANLKKGLKLRFTIAALLLFSASFGAGFVMLLPSYFLASSYLSRDASANDFLGLKNDRSTEEILNLPEAINSELTFFYANINDVSITDYLSEIVSCLPERVRLDSISFSRDQNYKEKKGTAILISGVADNRESLVKFSILLEKSDVFSATEVPVSSLTRERNLPFSINIFIENE